MLSDYMNEMRAKIAWEIVVNKQDELIEDVTAFIRELDSESSLEAFEKVVDLLMQIRD